MSASAASVRDPTHALYDQACAVLAAAQGVREASRRRQPPGDAVAALDCVAASLDALAAALDELGDRAAERLDADRVPPERDGRIQAGEAEAGFADLADRLRRASSR